VPADLACDPSPSTTGSERLRPQSPWSHGPGHEWGCGGGANGGGGGGHCGETCGPSGEMVDQQSRSNVDARGQQGNQQKHKQQGLACGADAANAAADDGAGTPSLSVRQFHSSFADGFADGAGGEKVFPCPDPSTLSTATFATCPALIEFTDTIETTSTTTTTPTRPAHVAASASAQAMTHPTWTPPTLHSPTFSPTVMPLPAMSASHLSAASVASVESRRPWSTPPWLPSISSCPATSGHDDQDPGPHVGVEPTLARLHGPLRHVAVVCPTTPVQAPGVHATPPEVGQVVPSTPQTRLNNNKMMTSPRKHEQQHPWTHSSAALIDADSNATATASVSVTSNATVTTSRSHLSDFFTLSSHRDEHSQNQPQSHNCSKPSCNHCTQLAFEAAVLTPKPDESPTLAPTLWVNTSPVPSSPSSSSTSTILLPPLAALVASASRSRVDLSVSAFRGAPAPDKAKETPRTTTGSSNSTPGPSDGAPQGSLAALDNRFHPYSRRSPQPMAPVSVHNDRSLFNAPKSPNMSAKHAEDSSARSFTFKKNKHKQNDVFNGEFTPSYLPHTSEVGRQL
jgi:hypothetical protein